MTQVGLFDAKTKLSDLVRKAAAGETFVITVHGRPMAKLVQVEESDTGMTTDEAITALLEFRKTHTLGDITIRELIDEGRKR